ncbi:MAG: LAGLIDADG family homing endonuclease [Elusimicrobia bacterium]|nr:LAGLIDADG family homing endonuclease [Elusimicrobiota bacterium]
MNTLETQLSLDPQYVTGLCEANASFTYGRVRSGIRLRFSLKLREADQNLAYGLQRFFGVGGVYPRWQYCVTNRAELRRIIDHFEHFPLFGRKGERFSVWKRIYQMNGTPSHWLETQELIAQLGTDL